MPERVFFTSDTHFFHKSILHLGHGRPFDTAEEMNETIIGRWNSCVSKQDRVYHLGDVSFGGAAATEEVLSRLNGHKHFIRGNHDNTLDSVLRRRPELAKSYQPYKEIKIGDQRVVLFHFPILSWHQAHRGSWHFHGHCHGNLRVTNGPMLDVGQDVWDFTPVEFDYLADVIRDRATWAPVDHHDKTPTMEIA